jgi:hypothetical protein
MEESQVHHEKRARKKGGTEDSNSAGEGEVWK